jgi:dienelactone hydrolase
MADPRYLLPIARVAALIATKWRGLPGYPGDAAMPQPRPSLSLAAKVALDEVLLAAMLLSARLPSNSERRRVKREVMAAQELFAERGWLAAPENYHREPPPLSEVLLTHARAGSHGFLHLRFDSEYEPRPEEPGRDRWMGYARNRLGHAWVLQHNDRPRPWLVCIHGYGMGHPLSDLSGFRAAWLHRKLGLNVVLPVLPLHGPRRVGERSGERFMSGDHLDTVHAEAQAMWDVRRLLTWARAQGGPAVGVYGLSLGGYNAALLAALEEDLACVIAGVPAICFVRFVRHHALTLQLRDPDLLKQMGEGAAQVLSVVSPLSLTPRVAWERRYLFGGVADRFIPVQHLCELWEHWARPRVLWYQGSHISFGWDRQVGAWLRAALAASGLVVARE